MPDKLLDLLLILTVSVLTASAAVLHPAGPGIVGALLLLGVCVVVAWLHKPKG